MNNNKIIVVLVTLLFSFVSVSAQNIDLESKAYEISGEGKLLYQLELAAWHGTEIFSNSFKEKERIGGYFSYIDKDKPKCLIFSKEKTPKVIGVVTFGNIQLVETATIDFKERDFKEHEKDLYTIRAKALEEIQKGEFIKSYSNTSLNIIPVIQNKQKKVFILTAPKTTGFVIFGNDYLLSFDKNNNISEKKELHKNLIPIEFDDEQEATESVHSHSNETNEFITPTDICTLMLYAKFAKWKRHIVASYKYVSIWDCEKETLKIVTKEEFEKMKD